MGMSLTDVLRKNDFNGLPIKTTKLIAKQVLTGLSYLHSLGIAHTDIKPDNILLYHSSRTMSKMLRAQLEADEAEKDRIAAEEALNPKPEPINWLEHKPKIPGLNPQQIREIQLARIRSEARRWTITPSMPLDSPIPFANGKKIVKEFVLANKHLYKAPRRGGYLPAPPKSTEVSTSQSGKNSLELDRTSAAHPGSTDGSPKAENADKKVETASTQTTPTKDIASNATSNRSSISPKGKGRDTTNTTESSMTAPSSRQSSKSPYASLNRLKPASNASSVFGKDPAGISFGRQFENMSISDLLKAQQQADEVDVVGIDKGRTHVEGLFATRHPRTSSNESTGQQETDFEKLLRQPMEYDIPGSSISSSGLAALGGLSIGGPSPTFMQTSPSDSGGSEIFSPASTTMTRFFPIHGAASSTDSPASMASTPIGSSPELLMARKLPSPAWPHPSASYSTAMPIPCAKALNRTGSIASIFASPSFTSFSPTEHSLMSLQESEYRARGGAESMAHPGLARARSDYGLEDGQAFVSLPSSPPSHPTSYLSLGSMSPEVTMGMGLRRTGAGGSGLPGLARSGSDASVGGIFDFAIQEQQEDETNTEDQAALDQLGSGHLKGDDANATLVAGTSKPRGLPGSNSLIQGLGLSMSSSFAQLKSLAIPKSMSDGQAVSPLISASPPTSMTSSFHSPMSQISEASPPSIQPSSGEANTTAAMPITQNQSQAQGPTPLFHEYKIERRLDSPARVRSDPLLNVHVKISDLGNAIFYHELKSKGALPENVCTRQYRPPENIIGAEYNLGVDVWALGCVVSASSCVSVCTGKRHSLMEVTYFRSSK